MDLEWGWDWGIFRGALEEGKNNLGGTTKLYSNAAFGTDGGGSEDAVAGTPVWASRKGDENNSVKVKVLGKDGALVDGVKDYPAPNLLPAFWNEPNTGISDAGCKAGAICGTFFSEESRPMQILHALPAFDSSSGFHDAGKISVAALKKRVCRVFKCAFHNALRFC